MARKGNYNNAFRKASERERVLIKQLANQLQANYVPAPEKCAYDAVLEKNGIISVIEAKVRNLNHNDFDTVLLEKGKYDRLMNMMSSNMCHKILYICFYNDNKALVFNLNKAEPKWTSDNFVKTTMGNNKKVEKVVAYLPITDAKIIDLI